VSADQEWENLKLLAGTFGSMVLLVVGLVTLMLTWPAFFQYWSGVSLPLTIVAVASGFGIDVWRAKRYARKQRRKRLTSVN
jgi:predicted benzoate:H+ symporter BenE